MIWESKSSIQPDGGGGLAKRKGVIARWGLKEAWSKAAVDKNGQRGLPGRTSEQLIAKSTVVNDRGKFGGRAVKAVGLPSGGLRFVPDWGLRPSQGGLTAAEVSRGHIRRNEFR